MFTVEIENPKEVNEEKHSVEIYINMDELENLINILQGLSDDSVGEHVHFFSESWGGNQLSEEKQNKANSLSHHLKIILTK